MPVPKNQITLRTNSEGLALRERVTRTIVQRSVIAPKQGDVDREVYHLGLSAMAARLGLVDRPADLPDLSEPADPEPPDEDEPVLSGEPT